MDVKFIPTIADAIKEYYKYSELVELSDLFDIGLGFSDATFDDRDLNYTKIARTLVTQIEHGNNRRFLEALAPSLVSRCMERIANTQWERQAYHSQMFARLQEFASLLEQGKIPMEITVLEDHPFTAKSEARDFLGKAETELIVVDNYVGPATLDCIRDVRQPIRLLTARLLQHFGR